MGAQLPTNGLNTTPRFGYGGEAIHNMTRWDWGQDLFEWMEYYLKGIGPKPAFTLKFSAMMENGELKTHGLH